ncbi:unnamed protein product [Paramecium octaurelia]|uniref:Uncharacterized protein n=1 Tax=Paramecium octaurelia TaxID=43137 RepID=A0A8S1VWL5_PAROT|nr:unnamed protein product [Paramecium octaurelia]
MRRNGVDYEQGETSNWQYKAMRRIGFSSNRLIGIDD